MRHYVVKHGPEFIQERSRGAGPVQMMVGQRRATAAFPEFQFNATHHRREDHRLGAPLTKPVVTPKDSELSRFR
jgi:hypothetical protein